MYVYACLLVHSSVRLSRPRRIEFNSIVAHSPCSCTCHTVPMHDQRSSSSTNHRLRRVTCGDTNSIHTIFINMYVCIYVYAPFPALLFFAAIASRRVVPRTLFPRILWLTWSQMVFTRSRVAASREGAASSCCSAPPMRRMRRRDVCKMT